MCVCVCVYVPYYGRMIITTRVHISITLEFECKFKWYRRQLLLSLLHAGYLIANLHQPEIFQVVHDGSIIPYRYIQFIRTLSLNER